MLRVVVPPRATDPPPDIPVPAVTVRDVFVMLRVVVPPRATEPPPESPVPAVTVTEELANLAFVIEPLVIFVAPRLRMVLLNASIVLLDRVWGLSIPTNVVDTSGMTIVRLAVCAIDTIVDVPIVAPARSMVMVLLGSVISVIWDIPTWPKSCAILSVR